MKPLALIGAGGHGKVVAEVAEDSGIRDVVFFDDGMTATKGNFHWQFKGHSDYFLSTATDYLGCFIAIGHNATRQKVNEKISWDIARELLLHPKATISTTATIERGTVVMAGAVINAYASIGEGVIINTSASIDHDCLISDYVHVSPGAHLGGEVFVGDRSWIGIGASVKNGVRIGKDVTVGAGAVVIKDIPDGHTVVGNPARRLR